MDILDIRVDIKLSTIKPIYAKLMVRPYSFFKSQAGHKIISSGWKAAGDYRRSEVLQRGELSVSWPSILIPSLV